MRKINLAILFITSLLLFACGNTDNNKEKADDTENNAETKTELVEETVKEPEQEIPVKTEILKIEEIKKGDIINGLTVKKAEYQKGSMYAIYFVGEISVKGNLQLNEMEETLDFFIEETSIPTSKIKVEGSEYDMYKILSFTNPAKLKNALNKEQLNSLNKGETVSLNISAKNPVIGQHFGNGRIGMASVDFLELN